MSYQAVRGAIEKTTYDSVSLAGIAADHVFFDNFGETPPGPDVPYAVISLSFDQTVQDVVGCEGVEDLRGSLNCAIYTPKQKGSMPGEDIAAKVVKAWVSTNKIGTAHLAGVAQLAFRNITGPSTLAPDQRPHHVNVVTCAFIARAV